MKPAKYNIYFISLMICHILISCSSENNTFSDDPEFSIKFTDGTIITEKDIAFYDSSTCFLFLNKAIDITVGNESPPYSFTEFSVFVNMDRIYQGIVYPSTLFNMPPDLYIFSKTYPTSKSDILPLICRILPKATLNDKRIIESLGKSNLLHHGITCTLDSVKICSDNDSVIICSITFKNNDQVNYYIPDPGKMDIRDFNVIANISLINKETNEHFHLAGNYDNFHWNITMHDLSILKSQEKVTRSYATPCKTAIKKGLYDCYLGVMASTTNLSINITIPLEQETGRVWLGITNSKAESIKVDYK